MSVCIVMPSQTMVHANFAVSLASLVGSSQLQIFIANPQGTYVPSNRTNGVRKALELECTHVLFYDTDMSVPPYSLLRLMEADKDIIGVNYVARMRPHPSLVHMKNGKAAEGICEVDRLPAGLMLIKTSVFKKIPEPWFRTDWFGTELGTEDYSFCDLARSHGFSIWMDTELSTQVIHWGDAGFRWVGEDKYEMVSL